jgi:phage shock protein A
VDLGPLIASVITSVGIVAAGYLAARRFQKLGGGEAEARLTKIQADLVTAMSEKVDLLEDQFKGCKTRLIEVEKTVERMRKERIDLKQEIVDLHDELKTFRPRRAKAVPTDD